MAKNKWKVTVNDQEFLIEAIKPTTAINRGISQYLWGKRISVFKPIDYSLLNHAKLKLDKIEEPKKVAVIKGNQCKLGDNINW